MEFAVPSVTSLPRTYLVVSLDDFDVLELVLGGGDFVLLFSNVGHLYVSLDNWATHVTPCTSQYKALLSFTHSHISRIGRPRGTRCCRSREHPYRSRLRRGPKDRLLGVNGATDRRLTWWIPGQCLRGAREDKEHSESGLHREAHGVKSEMR
jgi:hypothetical protein